MADNVSLRVQLQLAQSAGMDLNKQIQELEKKIKAIVLNIDTGKISDATKEQAKEIKILEKEYKALQSIIKEGAKADKKASDETKSVLKENKQAVSDLISLHKMGATSLKQFIAGSENLLKELNKEEISLKDIERLVTTVSNAEKKLTQESVSGSKLRRQAIDQENKQWANKIGTLTGESITTRGATLSQQVRSVLPTTPVASTSATTGINQQVSSIDRLIGRYKAGLITYQEFDKYGTKIAQSDNFRNKSLEQQTKLVNGLTNAEKQYTRQLNEEDVIRRRLSSQPISTQRTTPTTTVGGTLLNTSQIENSMIRLQGVQNRLSAMEAGSAGRFANPSEMASARSQIDALSNSLSTLTRPQVANAMAGINNNVRAMNSTMQNASRSSLNLGDSLHQASVKFPKV